MESGPGMEKSNVKRYEIHWVNLDPTKGSVQKKRRPCVIVSPDELNEVLSTVTIVPLTSTVRGFPFRTRCVVNGVSGELICEQIRTVSIERFDGKLGELSSKEAEELRQILYKMLCEE